MNIISGPFAKQSEHNNRQGWLNLLSLIGIAVSLGLLASASPILGILVIAAGVFFFVAWRKTSLFVYVWLLSSVFFAYRFEFGSVTLNLYRLAFILAVLILPFQPSWFASAFRRKRQACILLLMFILFTVGWLRSPAESRSVVTSELLLLYFWLSMFFYLLNFVDSKNQLYILVNIFLSTSSFVGGYGIYEMLVKLFSGTFPSLPFSQFADPRLANETSRSVIAGYNIARVTSFLNDPNLLGVYLTIAVLFLLAYFEQSKSRLRRICLIFLILVHITSIVFTVSRSGILLLCFSFLVLQLKRYRVREKKKRTMAVLVIITVVFLGGSMLYLLSPVFSAYVDSFVDAFYFRSSRIGDNRIMFMRTGWETFSSSPLMGRGMKHISLYNGKTTIAYTAHSFYLTILATYGVVGALIIGIFLWPLFKEAIRTILLCPQPHIFDLCFSLATLIIFAFQIVYDDLLDELMVLPFSILYIWMLFRRQRPAFTQPLETLCTIGHAE